ncbi:MAG: hypothetical protein IJ333_06720 [Clostridia bacterium]|nr:hypothetical protein [Clostridia bacterium]
MFDYVIQYLTDSMMDDLFWLKRNDRECLQLEREYDKYYLELKKALPSSSQDCLGDFDIAANALEGAELMLVYQKGLSDGIELMKELLLK